VPGGGSASGLTHLPNCSKDRPPVNDRSSRGTLAKIEAEIREINDRELIAIASVLGVTREELFPKVLLDRLRFEKGRTPRKNNFQSSLDAP